MQNKFNLLLNNGLKHGAIMGAAFILLGILYYISGVEFTNFTFIIVNFLVSIGLFVFFLVWSNRQAAKLSSTLNYGEALINSIITIVVSTLISAVYTYVFNAFFDPDYAKEMMQGVISSLENNPNMPADQIDKMYDQLEKMTPLSLTLDSLRQGLIFGGIMSLIVSAFTRKKEDPFAEEAETTTQN